MPMTQDVFRMAMGVVLLILVVLVLYKALLPPECDPMANATAQALAKAIDAVANEQGVSPWNQPGPPPDTATSNYYPVAIRLCEENAPREWFSAFSANPPTYQVLYEHFPDEATWAAWTESYPWSGGAGAALLSYAMLRCGTSKRCLIAVGTGGMSEIWHGVKWIGKAPVKVLTASMKLRRAWERLTAKIDALRGIAKETKPPGFLSKYLPQKVNTITDITTRDVLERRMFEFEELSKRGWIKNNPDQLLPGGKMRPRWVVNPAKKVRIDGKEVRLRDLLEASYDMMGDEAKDSFNKMYYIPSRFGWAEKGLVWGRGVKFKAKNVVGKWYKGSVFFNEIHKPLRKWWDGVKGKYRKYFKSHYGPEDTVEEAESNLRYAMENPKGARNILKTGFDDPDLKPSLLASLSESAKRPIKSIDELTDEEMFIFFKNYRDTFRLSPGIMDATTGTAPMKRSMDNFKKTIGRDMTDLEPQDFVDKYSKNWNELSSAEKLAFKSDITAGDVVMASKLIDEQLSDMWDAGRVALRHGDVMTTVGVYGKGLSFARTVSADKYNRGWYYATKSIVSKYPEDTKSKTVILELFLSERMAGAEIEKIAKNPAVAKARQMAGRWMFIDFRGRAPWTPLVEFAPGGGVYTMRQTEAMITEPKEGGCEWNSICLVSKTTATAVSLNESTAGYSVKLWRPKPSRTERLPIYIQTAWFYASVEENPRMYLVSPCFGQAKVWKSGSTVYVTVNKCKTPGTAGCAQSANYCYADSTLVWGDSNDNPNVAVAIGEWFGIFIPCMIGTQGGGFKPCSKAASYGTIALIWGETILSSKVDNPPSSKWGYWNYYKAGDICDIIDMFGSFGIKGFAKKLPAKFTTKGMKEWGNKINDVCMSFWIYGDTWLAWPIRGEWKGCGLDADTIKGEAAECAWAICDNDDECEDERGETKDNCPNDCTLPQRLYVIE